jgi:hypothetical protein
MRFAFLSRLVSGLRRPCRPSPTRRRVILRLERLEERAVPAGLLAVASDAGTTPAVALYHDSNNDGIPDASPFAVIPVLDAGFRGGVRVAVGNFIGDANRELVVGAGPGGGPRLELFQLDANDMPTGTFESFFALDPGFRGGLFVARAKLNGTAAHDSLLVGADAGGGPRVDIFSDDSTLNGAIPNDGLLANSRIDSFFVFDPGATFGVRLAAGRNLTAGAIGDFVVAVPGPGGGPRVDVLKDANGNGLLSDDVANRESFFALDPGFRGGLFVAVGDIGSPSANAEISIGAAAGGGPRVDIFTDANNNGMFSDDGGPVSSFFAYPVSFSGGVRLAASRLSPAANNLPGELVTAPGSSLALPVQVFKSKTTNGFIEPGDTPLAQFSPFGAGFTNGDFVAFAGNGI